MGRNGYILLAPLGSCSKPEWSPDNGNWRSAGGYRLYTVSLSWAAADADGQVALVFDTNAGVIAIDLAGTVGINSIRSALRDTEAMLGTIGRA